MPIEVQSRIYRDRNTVDNRDAVIEAPIAIASGASAPPLVSTGAPSGFPDDSNTGTSGALVFDSGIVTLSTPGQIYENRRCNGIVVTAANVTIRNVRVESQAFWGIRATSGVATCHDIEVIGDPAGNGCIWANGGQLHILRANCHNSEDGIRLQTNGCTVRDSYIHGLTSSTPELSHHDGLNADGYTGWEITGNTIFNPNNETSCVYVGDPRYDPSEGLFDGNLLAGGGYAVYGGHSTAPGIRVTNNHFSTLYYPDCGSLGTSAHWNANGNTWTGNVWHDGPNVGQTVNP